MIKAIKPLGYKAYGSIPYLPGSRLGEGDHHCHEGQSKIATEKVRDKHDVVIVQEKLDGSCCSVAKVNGEIIALGRAGYPAASSNYLVHHVFAEWVENNSARFELLLQEGERVVGEFLGMAIGTIYNLPHEPFVPFDIMRDKYRFPYFIFEERVREHGFNIPYMLHYGGPLSIETAVELIKKSGHGAVDPVEGAIWRVERKGEVDFLTKFVRHDKQDGKYLPESNNGLATWNIDVSHFNCLKNTSI